MKLRIFLTLVLLILAGLLSNISDSSTELIKSKVAVNQVEDSDDAYVATQVLSTTSGFTSIIIWITYICMLLLVWKDPIMKKMKV